MYQMKSHWKPSGDGSAATAGGTSTLFTQRSHETLVKETLAAMQAVGEAGRKGPSMALASLTQAVATLETVHAFHEAVFDGLLDRRNALLFWTEFMNGNGLDGLFECLHWLHQLKPDGVALLLRCFGPACNFSVSNSDVQRALTAWSPSKPQFVVQAYAVMSSVEEGVLGTVVGVWGSRRQ